VLWGVFRARGFSVWMACLQLSAPGQSDSFFHPPHHQHLWRRRKDRCASTAMILNENPFVIKVNGSVGRRRRPKLTLLRAHPCWEQRAPFNFGSVARGNRRQGDHFHGFEMTATRNCQSAGVRVHRVSH